MYMAYSFLGKPVSPETALAPPWKSLPMSPALSKLTSVVTAVMVAGLSM
jgi:hypothetical protein